MTRICETSRTWWPDEVFYYAGADWVVKDYVSIFAMSGKLLGSSVLELWYWRDHDGKMRRLLDWGG